MKFFSTLCLCLVAASGAAGCCAIAWLFPRPVVPPTPAAQPSPLHGAKPVPPLEHELTEQQRKEYYFFDEGIQYLPVDMILSLRRAYAIPPEKTPSLGFKVFDEPFLSRPERFGLYPNPWNENGPPLGVTQSSDPAYVPMAGINCATCHTTLLRGPSGKLMLVDGGSSQFRVEAFFPALVFALVDTVINAYTFDDFYAEFQRRSADRAACRTDCSAQVCVKDGLLCSIGLEPHKHEATPNVGDEVAEHDDALAAERGTRGKDDLRGDRGAPEYREFQRAALRYDATSNEFGVATEKYARHLDDVTSKLKNPIAPARRPATTLHAGAYPTSGELNTKLKVWVYLVKRIFHFRAVAAYAGSGGSPNGLGRSNPWQVVKNMLVANDASLEKLGISMGGTATANSAPPADASFAVNTPYLWGYDRQRWVFMAGVTNSMLERNLAQGVALLTDFNWDTWESTVSVVKLQEITSRYASQIKPPTWRDDVLGPIDAVRAAAGASVYVRECVGCHRQTVVAPGTGGTVNPYLDVGTDPWYVRAQVTPYYGSDFFREALARWIEAVKLNAYVRERTPEGKRICYEGDTADVCLRRAQPSFEKGREKVVWRGPQPNAIEAKPLHGVWATAPYLHNGSVPSIRELLTPPEQRARSFYVGSYDYDTAALGFTSPPVTPTPASASPTRYPPSPPLPLYYGTLLDVNLSGNGNLGHEYGTCLTEAEKLDLIEFLKSYQPGSPVDTATPGTPTCCGGPCGAK